MPKITFMSPDEQEFIINTVSGSSLMEVAVDNNVPGIDADCEGGCACATCHIIIPENFAATVTPLGEDEHYLLDFLNNRQKNSRLSCQIEVTDALDGIIIKVPNQD